MRELSLPADIILHPNHHGVFIMYAFPSGLSLYILVNTLFSIGQMAAVNKAYPMPDAAAGKA